MELDRKQYIGIAGITAVLLGILVLPLMVERYLGIDAIDAAFAVIVVYAALSWWMKRNPGIWS